VIAIRRARERRQSAFLETNMLAIKCEVLKDAEMATRNPKNIMNQTKHANRRGAKQLRGKKQKNGVGEQ